MLITKNKWETTQQSNKIYKTIFKMLDNRQHRNTEKGESYVCVPR